MVALRNQGNGGGRGISGLHWVWCIGRGPHLQLRQEPQVPLISDSDRRVPADLGQESQAFSCVEAWNSACLSRCPRGERPLVELYLEPGGFFRTMHGRVTAPSC